MSHRKLWSKIKCNTKIQRYKVRVLIASKGNPILAVKLTKFALIFCQTEFVVCSAMDFVFSSYLQIKQM